MNSTISPHQNNNPSNQSPQSHSADSVDSSQSHLPPSLTSFALHPSYRRHISTNFSPLPKTTHNPLFPSPRPLIKNSILERIHHPDLIKLIQNTEDIEYGEDELDSETEGDDTLYPDCKFLTSDTFVNRYTQSASRTAVTGCVELTRAICQGSITNAIAVVRPPGHHAGLPMGTEVSLFNSPDSFGGNFGKGNDNNDNNDNNDHFEENIEEMIEKNIENENFGKEIGIQGFCIYNNIAIAAQSALIEHPDVVKKVAIVDFDIHHGNGTQSIFYEKENVLFISIHRFAESFFPESGWFDETGTNSGNGFSINIPMENIKIRNLDFLMAFAAVILPILAEFCPDMIFISAGMDLLRGDPIGQMKYLSVEVIYHIIYILTVGKFNNDKIEQIGNTDQNERADQNNTNEDPQNIGRGTTIKHHTNRVLVALEGGYNDSVVADGIQTIVQALLDATNENIGKRSINQTQGEIFQDDGLNEKNGENNFEIINFDNLNTVYNVISNQVQKDNNDEVFDHSYEVFDPDNDGADIYQFYTTLHSAIQRFDQFWSKKLLKNPICEQLFQKIRQFEQEVCPVDKGELYCVGRLQGISKPLKFWEKFVQIWVSGEFLYRLWMKTIDRYVQ
jgi:acetoin utilization deacetylase AcuC-like enzyme